MAIWVHVMIRFGRWRQIIDEPVPDDADLYANLTATLYYGKGIAHAARGEVAEAEQARSQFLAARSVEMRARYPLCRKASRGSAGRPLELRHSRMAGLTSLAKAS